MKPLTVPSLDKKEGIGIVNVPKVFGDTVQEHNLI